MFRASAIAAGLFFSAVAQAQDIDAPLRQLATSQILPWLGDPVIITALNEQNLKHASLSQQDIDGLDKQWRAETKTRVRPLIDPILVNALSTFLKQKKNEGKGLYTEIFVMDNKGLNAGQSDVTSDYWQGDEAKWQKTFLAGPDAVYLDKIEKDESTQMLQSQISLSIVDPATKQVIGAVTLGINLDEALK